MPRNAAKDWWYIYDTGKLSHDEPAILFSRAKELSELKAKHGSPGESHEQVILRTALAIAKKRGLTARYESGMPSKLIFSRV